MKAASTMGKREVRKALTEGIREAWRDQVRSQCKRMPPEFQDFGVWQVRAWLKMSGVCSRVANRRKPAPEVLANALARLNDVKNWQPDACFNFVHPKESKKA